MIDSEHILISLELRHAERIFSGQKKVEFRKRKMHVCAGATIWFYVKLPVGSIVGFARVRKVDISSPAILWRKHGCVSGLSRSEFFSYFGDTVEGVALVLGNITRLDNLLTLEQLREIDTKFQPPQFFIRLTTTHPLRAAVANLD